MRVVTRSIPFSTLLGGPDIVTLPLIGGKSYMITGTATVQVDLNGVPTSTAYCGLRSFTSPNYSDIASPAPVTLPDGATVPVTLVGTWSGQADSQAQLFCGITNSNELTRVLAGARLVVQDVGSVTATTVP